MSHEQPAPRLETPLGWHLAALGFAMFAPSLTSWLYFVVLAGKPSVQAIYMASKVVQFAFPVVWVLMVQKRKIQFAWPAGAGPWLLGLALGTLIALSGLAAYYGYFKHSPWLAEIPEHVRRKLVDMRLVETSLGSARGLGSPLRYVLFGLFIMAPHAALEEYYWRWFVFGQLRRVIPPAWAIPLSGLAFMLHHVLVLNQFFPRHWPATALFSLCVAVGGATWAWMYQRRDSLIAPWVSHMLVDAAIFYIGYDLVWGAT